MTISKLIFEVPLDEIELSFSRSSGPGGQNVNKVSSRVALKWNPGKSKALSSWQLGQLMNSVSFYSKLNDQGELSITCAESRSQLQNRATAYQKLCQLVGAALKPKKKRIPVKPSKNVQEKRLKQKKHLSKIKAGRSATRKITLAEY